MLLVFVYTRRLIFIMLLLMYARMKLCTVSTNGMRERERATFFIPQQAANFIHIVIHINAPCIIIKLG